MDAKTAVKAIAYAIGVMEGEGCRNSDIDKLHETIDFIERQSRMAELGAAALKAIDKLVCSGKFDCEYCDDVHDCEFAEVCRLRKEVGE